jgi:two-component system CheB/CheR fusion protein
MATTRALRILIVDDHEDTIVVTAKILERSGHTVVRTRTASGARELAEREPYDLLISDIGLPDESGIELMRTLKTKYGIRGIALSGLEESDDREEAIHAGYIARMVKPINFEVLLKTIAEMTASQP